jgi:glycerophosphoryl diester phosphodiesterase
MHRVPYRLDKFRGLPLCLLVCALLPLPVVAFEFFEPVAPPRSFQVMAHRGALSQSPENTAPALERCVEDGFEWAEVDVRLSKDGRHVVFHDGQVDGKTDGRGAIRSLSLHEIKGLDAGAWFAPRFAGERLLTLKECLDLSKDRLNLYLDCKRIDARLLVEEIRAAGMERQVVVFDDPLVLARIKRLSKDRIPIMPKWHAEYGTEAWVVKWRPDAVEINADEVTADTCARFHANAIKVQAKVLGKHDHPEVWDRMLDAGVDWLQTDLPEDILAHQMWKTLPNRPVEIVFHRGACRYAPENTLAAFEKAIRMGADYIEFDIRRSEDGAYFIFHDRHLERTTNGEGAFAEMGSEAIHALDAGSWFGKPYGSAKVPTLDETLECLKGRTKLYVDAKAIPAEALAAKLEQYGLVDQAVVYQSPGYLRELRSINPAIRRLCPLSEAGRINVLIELVRPYAFDSSWNILSQEMINRCHELGVKVFSDAMGENERIEAYIRAMEWGIDAIQTDYPLRVVRAVELLRTRREH